MRSILLLRNPNQQLPLVEKLLESRGFKVTVVHRISDAVYFITEKRPDFAFFSTELIPNDSLWIIQVLKQLTSVVLFAGRISAKYLSVSQELKGTYLLEPPLTPLGFEMMIRRIDHDHRIQGKATPKLGNDHLMIMSTLSELALKAMCSPTQTSATYQGINKISKVTCFRVQTKSLSGFFVFAYGDNRSFEATWMEEMRMELHRYLKSYDETSELNAAEEIMIAEVRFPDWSKEQAQFIHKASLQDTELALAFFKDADDLQPKASSRADHVEVDMTHLRGDAVVNYDVYVYLPQNARFVLYTPKGGTFSERKKQRLLSEGIQSVHIHKHSFDELKKTKAREMLEQGASAFR